jgi:hypothetical protein
MSKLGGRSGRAIGPSGAAVPEWAARSVTGAADAGRRRPGLFRSAVRAQGLMGTWKAMTVQGPDGAEVVPPYLPFWAMDPICSSAASL